MPRAQTGPSHPRGSAAAPANLQVQRLLAAFDQAFDRRSWHGPNLMGTLRGVTADVAARRPQPGRKSIAEQALHAAYWKYVIRRRLTGIKRGSFAIAGSNWPPPPTPWNDAAWRRCLEILVSEHAALRAAIAALSDRDLDRPAGPRDTVALLVTGAAAHDLYHAGQIALLRRLVAGEAAAEP